jgi:hypothetical protein
MASPRDCSVCCVKGSNPRGFNQEIISVPPLNILGTVEVINSWPSPVLFRTTLTRQGATLCIPHNLT